MPIRALVLAALALSLFGGVGASSVAAQAKTEQTSDDALARMWLDTTVYTGTPQGDHSQTVIAPVASADFKLARLLRLGGDLPFAAGWGRAADQVLNMPGVFSSASASRFVVGNPDLRIDLEVSSGPVLGRVGFAFAFSIPNATATNPDSAEGLRALGLASASRGTWNQWWWMLDTYTAVMPFELRYRRDGFAIGGEGAFAITFPGSATNDQRDVGMIAQFGGFIAAVHDKTGSVGIRERTVIPLSNRRQVPVNVASPSTTFSLLPSQSSLEVYGELHLAKVLLLGAGLLFNLDEPFGFFADGQDIWGARITLGAALN